MNLQPLTKSNLRAGMMGNPPVVAYAYEDLGRLIDTSGVNTGAMYQQVAMPEKKYLAYSPYKIAVVIYYPGRKADGEQSLAGHASLLLYYGDGNDVEVNYGPYETSGIYEKAIILVRKNPMDYINTERKKGPREVFTYDLILTEAELEEVTRQINIVFRDYAEIYIKKTNDKDAREGNLVCAYQVTATIGQQYIVIATNCTTYVQYILCKAVPAKAGFLMAEMPVVSPTGRFTSYRLGITNGFKGVLDKYPKNVLVRQGRAK